MGQYWELYNLDKEAAIIFSHSFKLVTWFFGDDPTRILTKLRRGSESSWAGDRIICMGDYAHSLPEGVVARVEIYTLMGKETPLTTPNELPLDSNEVQKFFDLITFQGESVPIQENFDYSGYVLRNLTKKKFVRGDNPPVGIPGRIANSFGQTLFARICWSDDPSTNTQDREITRGQWAGDRFDVVEFEAVKDELDNEGWEDCTEELKQRVEGIYRVEGLI